MRCVQVATMQRDSTWQTLLRSTRLLVPPARYPRGFSLVVAASPHNITVCGGCGECGGCEAGGSVGLSITLERNASQADYLLATLLTTGAFLLIFILVSLISRSLKYEYKLFEELPRLLR